MVWPVSFDGGLVCCFPLLLYYALLCRYALRGQTFGTPVSVVSQSLDKARLREPNYLGLQHSAPANRAMEAILGQVDTSWRSGHDWQSHSDVSKHRCAVLRTHEAGTDETARSWNGVGWMMDRKDDGEVDGASHRIAISHYPQQHRPCGLHKCLGIRWRVGHFCENLPCQCRLSILVEARREGSGRSRCRPPPALKWKRLSVIITRVPRRPFRPTVWLSVM